VSSLAYSHEMEALAAGGSGGAIKVIRLRPAARAVSKGTAALPDVLEGHAGRVTALAMLGNFVVASGGADRQIRFWDLHTMKEIEAGRKQEAHQAPLSGLAHIPWRDQLASTALENVAKVWDVRAPHAARIVFQIETPGEIAALRWLPWRGVWVSLSDDGAARLWGPDGDLRFQFGINGGPVQSALVDEKRQLLLAAMQDNRVRAYDLKDPVPKARHGPVHRLYWSRQYCSSPPLCRSPLPWLRFPASKDQAYLAPDRHRCTPAKAMQ
jgi:WD40 repeat protein